MKGCQTMNTFDEIKEPNTRVTLDDLMKLIAEYCTARDWDQFHTPKDLAIGAATEAGELLDIFRFKTPEDMKAMLADEKQREHIGEELSDVLFFVLRFSQLYGFDLQKAFYRKMAINAKKYPVDKVKGCNKKYTEY